MVVIITEPVENSGLSSPLTLGVFIQVSWLWRSIVELDQLWMPKCVRLGWCINFSPSPLEQGVWKRLYIQTAQELRVTSLQVRRPDPRKCCVPGNP